MVRSFGTITEAEAKTGDLVFFNHDGVARTASHVGLLVVNEDGSKAVLHMTDHGVKLSRLWDSNGHSDYWGNRSPCFSKNPALN
jgi:cell wall-associated NlpC family hydrolase